MTTASNIIQSAYRENNIIAVGKSPSAAEEAEALALLNSIVKTVFGTTIGVFAIPWPVPPKPAASYNARYPNNAYEQWPTDSETINHPPNNVRIHYGAQAATKVFLPQVPDDGAQLRVAPNGADFAANPLTISANGFLINAAPELVIDTTPTEERVFFFRADLSSWTEIVPLEVVRDTTIPGTNRTTTDTEMPFPEEFDDYFIVALNARLSTRNAKQVQEASAARFAEVEKRMKTKYQQVLDSTFDPRGDQFRSHQSLGAGSGTFHRNLLR